MKIPTSILTFKMPSNDSTNHGACYCHNVFRIAFGRPVSLNNEPSDEDDDDFTDDIPLAELSEHLLKKKKKEKKGGSDSDLPEVE